MRPLIIDDVDTAKQIHIFESQWDAFALADRTDLYQTEGVAFIATRGAGNATLVKGLIPEGVSVCAWPQNDAAGEKWLTDLCAHAGVKLAKALVPAPHKDVNEWTAAGASAEEIYGAMWRNELVYEPPKPSDLGTLLDAICEYLRRFVAFSSDAQPIAVALWIMHTWVVEAFDYTPYLHIVSPEKRCGKTRLLDCIEVITPKPWRIVSPSEAVLFRKIQADQPTLLLDEVDTFFSHGKDEGKEALRALLNSGFDRRAKVPRCVPPNNDIKEFGVFCPKALAGIGKLPDTVGDRCISIQLVRRAREEPIERFRRRDAEMTAAPIREGLVKWAKVKEIIDKLQAARPAFPEALGDRQRDICEPLFAIAEMTGSDWPERARRALTELCTSQSEEDDSIGIRLLSDIRNIFNSNGADRLATKELLEALVAQENDAPWSERWEHDLRNDTRGPAAKLARLLKPYGIKGRGIRLPDGTTPRGYMREDFEETWTRYCPSKVVKDATTQQTAVSRGKTKKPMMQQSYPALHLSNYGQTHPFS